MNRRFLRALLCLSVLGLYGVAVVGCGSSAPSTTTETDDHDHDHDHDGDHSHEDEHDHSEHDHAEHDHPAHGIHGGHMVGLSGDNDVEVQFMEGDDEFNVFVGETLSAEEVSGVAMKTDIEGTVSEYDFEQSETPDGVVFSIKSPELATAVKMGDAVKTTLVITTKDGEVSGDYKHHSH